MALDIVRAGSRVAVKVVERVYGRTAPADHFAARIADPPNSRGTDGGAVCGAGEGSAGEWMRGVARAPLLRAIEWGPSLKSSLALRRVWRVSLPTGAPCGSSRRPWGRGQEDATAAQEAVVKKTLAVLAVAASLLAIPASHLIGGPKGHVPLHKAQVCHKGKVITVSVNALPAHQGRHGDCQLPACDFNNVFHTGEACDSNNPGGECTLPNPRDGADGVTPGCPVGRF